MPDQSFWNRGLNVWRFFGRSRSRVSINYEVDRRDWIGTRDDSAKKHHRMDFGNGEGGEGV